MAHHTGGWVLAVWTVDIVIHMTLGHAMALVDL